MADIKKLLSAEDIKAINATGATSWVPKNPRDLILPFSQDVGKDVDPLSIEVRREKAKKVVDGYADVIARCRQLEDEISQRCKDVSVTLTPAKHLNVIQAIGRVFGGGEQSNITFEMYKACVHALAAIGNKLPQPGEK